jgi:hypothetical protein
MVWWQMRERVGANALTLWNQLVSGNIFICKWRRHYAALHCMHCVMCVQRIGITGEASWSFCIAQNKASVQMRANPTRMSLLADPRAALPIKLACVRSSRSSQPKLIIPQYFYTCTYSQKSLTCVYTLTQFLWPESRFVIINV